MPTSQRETPEDGRRHRCRGRYAGRLFLPSKRAVRRGSHSPKLDVGIDANALTDHHRVAGENTLEAATRTLIVKKFGEGFVPYRDNVTESGFP